MAKKAKFTAYRDRLTGRFVSKAVYKRKGRKRYAFGKRYVQERVKVGKHEPSPTPTTGTHDWLLGFTYEPSGRSFDVLVTARDEHEAYDVAKQFLREDADAQRIVRANFRNWGITIARGRTTKVLPGEAEYRSKSRTKGGE
jgi:hypothetical protein